MITSLVQIIRRLHLEIIKIVKFQSFISASIIGFALFTSEASAVSIASYIPHSPGNQWTYSNGVGGSRTITVGNTVNLPSGVQAYAQTDYKTSDAVTSTDYFTLDSSGYQLHQMSIDKVYINGYGYTSSNAVFSPAVKYTPADVNIGDTYNSTGSVSITYTGVTTVSLSYSMSTQVIGYENITSQSLGQSWQAVKVQTTLTIYGNINGQFTSSTATATQWLVDGKGTVQALAPNTSNVNETWKLVSTNVTSPTTTTTSSTTTTTTSTSTSTSTTVASTTTTTQSNGNTITITSPIENGVTDSVFNVIANIQSAYEIKSVSATIAGKNITLAYSSTGSGGRYPTPAWVGSVNLSGISPGSYALEVQALNAINQSFRQIRNIKLDAKPILNVSKPVAYGVASPGIDFDISCSDDNSGCKIVVTDSSGIELVSGVGKIQSNINLSKYSGSQTVVTVTATDSIGQKTIKTLNIPVVNSNRLIKQFEVPGKVLDFSAERILYFDDSSIPRSLYIKNNQTGASTVIYSADDANITQAYLHPLGAAFIDNGASSTNTKVYDWRNGGLILLSTSYQSTGGFLLSGNYLTLFNLNNTGYTGYYDYYIRDLNTGTNTLISKSVGNNSNSLQSNGAVAYWKGVSPNYDIYFWKNGVTQQVTNGGGSVYNIYPLTDGSKIIFKQSTPCCGSQTYKIQYWNGSTVQTLADLGGVEPSQYRNYAIANGYLAYSKPGSSGQLQIWRQYPDGSQEQVTQFSTTSLIDTLSNTGAITFTNGTKLLFIDAKSSDIVELPMGLEKRVWLNGQLYGMVGGSVFSIDKSVVVNTTINSTTTTSTSTSTTSTTITSTTTTTLNSRGILSLKLGQGWNLIGNTINQSLSVNAVFGDPAQVLTVWKWDVSKNGWQFFTPSLDATTLKSYADLKGYDVLSKINPGEGFWINSKSAIDLGTIYGGPYSFPASNLVQGWNLIATADNLSPSGFNLAIADPLNPPPSAGTIPINFISLWAWDNDLSKWYFYAPNLDAQGGNVLSSYITNKGYLDFASKALGPSFGFWVNMPAK